MSIKTVNVFLHHTDKKIVVGKLAYKDGVIYFEYDSDFLDRKIQLSPYKLPLNSGVHICDDKVFEGLFGVFGDSLPDGWGRLLLDRHFLKRGMQYSDITPLDRLRYIGKFGIGALSYKPIIDSINATSNETIVLDHLAAASYEILHGNSEDMIDNLLSLGGSSAGARPKVMLQLSQDKKQILHGSQNLRDGYEHWMVKFAASNDGDDIGKIEYTYSLMAKDANINISETALLQGKTNSYFATKRFDRVGDQRVHMHSVAGLTHSDFRMPTLDYDDLLALTLHLTKDINEQLKMFRLACFNLFAHNRDDHAKNFSFILDSNGMWKLSPAYDLTFSYGPGGEHSTTYLGEGKNPTSGNLLALAKKHNIKNSQIIIDEVKKVVSNFTNYGNKAGVKTSSQLAISSILKKLI